MKIDWQKERTKVPAIFLFLLGLAVILGIFLAK
jgi:hypothetical protein